jgi:hypothetical protein
MRCIHKNEKNNIQRRLARACRSGLLVQQVPRQFLPYRPSAPVSPPRDLAHPFSVVASMTRITVRPLALCTEKLS